jgi:hypothetical protein
MIGFTYTENHQLPRSVLIMRYVISMLMTPQEIYPSIKTFIIIRFTSIPMILRDVLKRLQMRTGMKSRIATIAMVNLIAIITPSLALNERFCITTMQLMERITTPVTP